MTPNTRVLPPCGRPSSRYVHERTRSMLRMVKAFALLITLVISCSCQNKTSNWPHEVTASLIVPKDSIDINYYELQGSYQVMYKAAACYPADQFIKSLADQMSSHGWKRLQEDFLNPGVKNSCTRGSNIYEQWGYFKEKGEDVHQWIDDWEDSQTNIVRYGLRYRTKPKGNHSISSKDCNLQVVVIYVPHNIRPPATDLESMKNSK